MRPWKYDVGNSICSEHAKRFDYPTIVILFRGNKEHEKCSWYKTFLHFIPTLLLMFLVAPEEDYRTVVETFGYYNFVVNG